MTDKELLNRAKTVKKKYEAELFTYPGVAGVGVGIRQQQGEYIEEVCIVVTVNKKYSPEDLDPDQRLPRDLEGIPVDVQEVGNISI